MSHARFWLFASLVTAPAGGMHDFQGAFDALAPALQAGALAMGASALDGWFHIVDTETKQIIAGSRRQAFAAPRLALPPDRLFK